MRAARLANSQRLQRTLRVLQEAKGDLSTLEIVLRADVCAVNSAIAELRANGAEIKCRQTVDANRQPVFLYTLLKSPETTHETTEVD